MRQAITATARRCVGRTSGDAAKARGGAIRTEARREGSRLHPNKLIRRLPVSGLQAARTTFGS